MIGLFLCWIAGSYWKKIYYAYITFMEIMMVLFCCMGATIGEEGDADAVTGFELLVLVLIILFVIIILFSYAVNKKIADALNMFAVMLMALMEYLLFFASRSGLVLIFIFVFLLISIFAAIFVYWLDSYSAVLPSSTFAVTCAIFLMCFMSAESQKEFIPEKGWKGSLLFWGVMILFTAAGCLIQLLILKKTEMGTKKRNKLSEVLK